MTTTPHSLGRLSQAPIEVTTVRHNHVPYFSNVYTSYNANGEPVKVVVPNKRYLIGYRYIQLLVRAGLSIRQACERLEEKLAVRELRPAIPCCGVHPSHRKYCNHKSAGRLIKKWLYPSWTPSRFKGVSQARYDESRLVWRSIRSDTKLQLSCVEREMYE